MRVISFILISGATLSWKADEDCVLRGAVAHLPAILHLEEGLTFALWAAGLIDSVRTNFLVYLNAAGSQQPAWLPFDSLNFVIPKNQEIFISPEFSSTLAQLFIEPLLNGS